MKKIILILWFFIATLPSIFSYAANCSFDKNANPEDFLQSCSEGTVWIKPPAWETKTSIKERVKTIATWAISLGALFAVGALVWAGIQYTKAYGEDESLKKAKTTWIYALIGLFLLMASFGLVNIFINFVYTVAGQ